MCYCNSSSGGGGELDKDIMRMMSVMPSSNVCATVHAWNAIILLLLSFGGALSSSLNGFG